MEVRISSATSRWVRPVSGTKDHPGRRAISRASRAPAISSSGMPARRYPSLTTNSTRGSRASWESAPTAKKWDAMNGGTSAGDRPKWRSTTRTTWGSTAIAAS